MKITSPDAARKCTERADARPPTTSSTHGHAAAIVGDSARPDTIIAGISTKIAAT